MNWLQKIASVTFTLEGSHKISQPKTILDLIYDLQRFASAKGVELPFQTVEPDGDSFDKMTGTINWYVTNEISEEDRQKIMQAWIQEMSIMDYQMQIRGPERSGMNDWAPTDGPDLMVYRLDVLKNGSEDYTEIPEMNVANENAVALLGSLNIPFDQSGSIDLRDIRKRLATTTQSQLGEFTSNEINTLNDPEHQGVREFDPGRDIEKMQRYVGMLAQIVDYGIKNGFQNLQWT